MIEIRFADQCDLQLGQFKPAPEPRLPFFGRCQSTTVVLLSSSKSIGLASGGTRQDSTTSVKAPGFHAGAGKFQGVKNANQQ